MKNVNFSDLPKVISDIIKAKEGSDFVPDSVSVHLRSGSSRDADGSVVQLEPHIEVFYGLGGYRSSIAQIPATKAVKDWFNALA